MFLVPEHQVLPGFPTRCRVLSTVTSPPVDRCGHRLDAASIRRRPGGERGGVLRLDPTLRVRCALSLSSYLCCQCTFSIFESRIFSWDSFGAFNFFLAANSRKIIEVNLAGAQLAI